jgi:hypothetical protein
MRMQRPFAATRLTGAWMPAVALVVAAVVVGTEARAEADGPDFLRVRGVGVGSVLNIRSGPGLGHQIVGSLPYDADGIRNLGCEGGPTFAEWEASSAAEREAASRRRWCRIEHGGTVGWAAGWHLGEGSAPDAGSGPGDLSALVGARWSLVFAPTGAAVGEAWIEFAADGAVHGKLGCNAFRGNAEVTGQEIRTSPLATTRLLCPEPGVNRQEQAVVAVLSAPVRWQLVDGQLALVSADRTQELLFASD